MKFTPHPYQLDAMKFMASRRHAGLLLPVGLGKTVVTLKVIQAMHKAGTIKRTLIVGPLRSLYEVWPKELAKWDDFAGMTMVNLRDNPTQRGQLEVINPDNLLKVLEKYPGRWDSLIIDEASMFKDSSTKRFKAIKAALGFFKVRFILTGSPAPNGLPDIWALAYIVDQGKALGEFVSHFRATYCMKENPYSKFSRWVVIPGMDKHIYQALHPIMYRIDVNDAGLKLPELVKNTISVTLPPQARSRYLEMENSFITTVENETIHSPHAAAAGMRCRQIANGQIYVPDSFPRKAVLVHREKIEALENLVIEQSGQPILILYEFDHDEEAIQDSLGPDVPNLTKTTRPAELQQLVADWNAGKIPVMLGHPRSMGRALNLQGSCSAVCFFGIPWSLDDYEQSIGRVHRQGNEAHRVVVHHIVAHDTLDERVVAVLRQKARVQNDLNRALTRRPVTESPAEIAEANPV